MRRLLPLLALSAIALSAPAFAQRGREGPDPVGQKGPVDTEKVKLVYVYGEDPCPASTADEIMICAKLPDADRYRIPKELRSDLNAPQNQSWANRARSIETIGASGINSCSPAGAGGFTGCFSQLARKMKEERKTMLDSATWADAVAKAREKRLANLDADSEKIEKQVKADEADAGAQAQAEAAARARVDAQDKAAGTAGTKAN